jgi:hypothetical protein
LEPPFLRSRALINERIELADGGRLADSELLTTPVVTDSSDKRRDDLAITSVHHTMGMLAETLHEAVQRLFGALGQHQQVIKGSRALVPALKCINGLLT